MPPLEACSVAVYGNLFNLGSQERTLDRRRPPSGPMAQLENGRSRIINTPIGQELTQS
jgi:hypothetical protein